jgi:hypothetical protein
MAKDTKKELLNFIDHKAFDVILKKDAGKMDGKEQDQLEELQRKTKKEQEKFHGYGSAKEIKENFLANVRSKPAHKLNKGLKDLKLPTLPDLKDDFEALCNKLGV